MEDELKNRIYIPRQNGTPTSVAVCDASHRIASAIAGWLVGPHFIGANRPAPDQVQAQAAPPPRNMARTMLTLPIVPPCSLRDGFDIIVATINYMSTSYIAHCKILDRDLLRESPSCVNHQQGRPCTIALVVPP